MTLSHTQPQLVLGLGGCVDHEIELRADILEQLVETYAIEGDDLDEPRELQSERDVVCTILSFVAKGAGGERYVSSAAPLVQFGDRFAHRATLGGTAVRVALALAKVEICSLLHLVSMDDTVRRLLPGRVEWISSAEHDTLDPHLIVQFPEGIRIRLKDRELVAPRANRVILVHDEPNATLRLSDRLPAVLAQAKWFLVSNLNAMRNEDLARQRLKELAIAMRSLPPDALVVYEEGAFHSSTIRSVVLDGLRGRIDVHSMNEDEFSEYIGATAESFGIRALADQLRDLRMQLETRVLIVHSQNWALAVAKDASEWKSTLQNGVAFASARYALGDDLQLESIEEMRRSSTSSEGQSFAQRIEAESDGEICCVPAHNVQTPHPTTVGLGDTFVAGLLAHLVEKDDENATSRPARKPAS